MTMRLCIVVLLGLLAWVAPSIVRAQNCTVTVTGVAFGTYDPLSATPRDVNGSIQVDCILEQAPVTISFDAGDNSSNVFANRRMVSGAFNLPYQLYTNAARSIVWGDGTGGTQTVTCTTGVTNGVCTGSAVLFGFVQRTTRPVYGRIPTSQDVGIGNYNDSVTVTVVF